MTQKFQLLLTGLMMLFASAALAQEGEATGGSEYVEMQPPFIVAYGGPGPLKYLKADVTLMVPAGPAEANVKLHTPALRNAMVMLLSSQSSEDVGTAAGRDRVRLQALESLRDVMVSEYGNRGYDMIKDLLFTSFVVQE